MEKAYLHGLEELRSRQNRPTPHDVEVQRVFLRLRRDDQRHAPGNVATNIGNNNGRIYRALKKNIILPSAKDPRVSAKALLYLASSGELEGISGKFFNLTTEETPAPHARDQGAVMAVWNKSLALCGLS